MAEPIRSDARRNRDKLLQVATAAFATAEGRPVSLESIARDAGVGIGTLYRHFPTREALVEAVYAAELDDVTGSAPALLARLPPDAALRAWMDRYAEFSTRKRGMIGTLRAGWSAGRITPRTRERINAAIGTILEAGTQSGAFRDDVEADDVHARLPEHIHQRQAHIAKSDDGHGERAGLELVLEFRICFDGDAQVHGRPSAAWAEAMRRWFPPN